jgi:hypothetical protein
MLFILAILVAKGVFRDYETIEELFNLVPPGEEMYHLSGMRKCFVSLSLRACLLRARSRTRLHTAVVLES